MEPTTAISPPVEDQEKLHSRFDEEAVADELESKTASEVLEWAFSQFGQDMYIACSFQKLSLIHI